MYKTLKSYLKGLYQAASPLVTAMGGGVVRHAATGAAGWLIARGVIEGNQESQAIGALVFAAGVAWSLYAKWVTA